MGVRYIKCTPDRRPPVRGSTVCESHHFSALHSRLCISAHLQSIRRALFPFEDITGATVENDYFFLIFCFTRWKIYKICGKIWSNKSKIDQNSTDNTTFYIIIVSKDLNITQLSHNNLDIKDKKQLHLKIFFFVISISLFFFFRKTVLLSTFTYYLIYDFSV